MVLWRDCERDRMFYNFPLESQCERSDVAVGVIIQKTRLYQTSCVP